jgi:hypothetical protein
VPNTHTHIYIYIYIYAYTHTHTHTRTRADRGGGGVCAFTAGLLRDLALACQVQPVADRNLSSQQRALFVWGRQTSERLKSANFHTQRHTLTYKYIRSQTHTLAHIHIRSLTYTHAQSHTPTP